MNQNTNSIKLYNTFDQSSRILHASENLISIFDCEFDHDEKTKNDVYYIGGKDASIMKIQECKFSGKLNKGEHYIDGKLYDSHKIFIELCQFEYDINVSVNSEEKCKIRN